jgi:uncharacterized membrane protein YgdD (TMEM256/DUF423 family)
MNAQRRGGAAFAALVGLAAVASGAFGAHAATDPAARELLRTGAQYQGLHALAAFTALAVAPGRTGAVAGWLLALGALLFGASLDALAAGAPRAVGAVTPLGGLLMMGGWAALALWALTRGRGQAA